MSAASENLLDGQKSELARGFRERKARKPSYAKPSSFAGSSTFAKAMADETEDRTEGRRKGIRGMAPTKHTNHTKVEPEWIAELDKIGSETWK